jgi:LysM repeat protein
MPKFVIVLIIACVVVALAMVIGIAAVRNRSVPASTSTTSSSQTVTYETTVDGQTITIHKEPTQNLVIIATEPLAEPATFSGDSIVVIEPSPTPPLIVEEIVPTAEPTAIVIQPTIPPTIPDGNTGGGASINTAVPSIISQPHTVQQGNTLFSLSRSYNTTIELMAARGISSASLIPGQVIQIPVANPAYCINSRPYVVQSGDTAFGLARQSGITLEQFRTINQLDANYSLSITQVVCILG